MCKSEIFAGAIGKNFNRQELKRASEDEIYMQRWNLCRGLSAKVSKGKGFLGSLKAKLYLLNFEFMMTTGGQMTQLRLLPDVNVFVRQCLSTTKRR
jgi:hypothetical protein